MDPMMGFCIRHFPEDAQHILSNPRRVEWDLADPACMGGTMLAVLLAKEVPEFKLGFLCGCEDCPASTYV